MFKPGMAKIKSISLRLFDPMRKGLAITACTVVIFPFSQILHADLPITGPHSGGGAVSFPEPYDKDDFFPSGCLVTFSSGPGIKGPPCAFYCDNLAPEDMPMSYQELCNTMEENEHVESYVDSKGNFFTGDEAGSNNFNCVVHKGVVGQKIGRHIFPNGHKRCFGVKGDPHLKSFDGEVFDFQAAGEFIASTSLDDNFELQIRLEPYTDHVSVATAVALRFGPHRISIRVREDKPLRVNGKVVELAEYTPLLLDNDGAFIVRTRERYTIVLSDGTNVHAEQFSRGLMNVYLLLAESRDGRMKGISGDGNGDRSNDFQTGGGIQLPAPVPFERLYGEFADSWRVTAENSLFDYAEGETPASFVKADMPVAPFTLEQIPIGDRIRAEQACRDAGLRSGPPLEECIFDFAATGDEIFITSALSQQIPASLALEPTELNVDFPSTSLAAHRVTLALDGPITRGSWLGFAPKGSANQAESGTIYSSTVLNGNEEKVDLIVPNAPGEYEMRYRDTSGATIFQRAPFVVLPPEVEIIAPDSAPVGGEVTVQLKGDIGQHMLVSIVPLGSPDNTQGLNAPTNQGTEYTATIQSLPNEPGQYEIRCSGNFSIKGDIYARRPLALK